jgi:hypothetical protein
MQRVECSKQDASVADDLHQKAKLRAWILDDRRRGEKIGVLRPNSHYNGEHPITRSPSRTLLYNSKNFTRSRGVASNPT